MNSSQIYRLLDPATKKKILAEETTIKNELLQDLPSLMGQVFPLGEKPNYDEKKVDF